MSGERGGTVANLEDATKLQEQHKPDRSAQIRWRIVECLVNKGEFHADDLIDLDISPADKNVIGAAVRGAGPKGRGFMRRVGWRESSRPQRHGGVNRVFEVVPERLPELRELLAGRKPEEPGRLFELPARPGHMDVDAA